MIHPNYGPRRLSSHLRGELSTINVARAKAHTHELTCSEQPSVIYSEIDGGTHGNFLSAAYRRILATPKWRTRLEKPYTGSRTVPRAMDRKRLELDCANSSDALLMNVFCYPGVLSRPSFCGTLGIDRKAWPEFGFHPRTPLHGSKFDRTEIDLRLGDLLIEAKLTEGDFQTARLELIQRYRNFDDVFELELLPVAGDGIRSYQLIRGILAADFLNCSYSLLCDQRRHDLIEDWYRVVSSVRRADLRCRLKLVTWQDLAGTLSRKQQFFLKEKYGIVSNM